MELFTTYAIAHGCLVFAGWLLTHADNQPIPPPTRYLGGKPISQKLTTRVRTTQLWF